MPTIKFQGVSFESALKKVGEIAGLSIVPNWMALEAQAIEKDHEVNIRLNNEQLGRALQLLLDEVGGGEVELMYVVENEVVLVSTKEDLSRKTTFVVYSVGDLLPEGDTRSQPPPEAEGDDERRNSPSWPLARLIMETVEPESWRDAGGNVGNIRPLKNELIICQTKWGHRQIRDLLADVRKSIAGTYTIDAVVFRMNATAEALFRKSAVRFPYFGQSEFAGFEKPVPGYTRLSRLNGTADTHHQMKMESHWQVPPSSPTHEGTFFALNVAINSGRSPDQDAVRFRIDLELVGPLDLPLGSSAVTGPHDISPANWNAAGVKAWQVRRISTIVSVKSGEAIALMIPPENPKQLDGSSSDWILIQPRLQK
ncbi:MAG: hypothetical protein IPK83_07330 [Planctomycetes bacterium]|nr:hypothetical protein [Planctomycetota bacterium]